MLVDHIRRGHPKALLAVLCATPQWAVDVAYPWELPADIMSAELVETLHHARNFSEVAFGPQLVYNLLLARRAGVELDWETEELESVLSENLMTWTEGMVERLKEVRAWAAALPEFWTLLSDCNIGPGLKEFVGIMVKRIASDPEGFASDPAVEERIRSRELRLKSKRARLTHRSALENWNRAAVGATPFDFRWGITRSYLNDIAAALESVV